MISAILGTLATALPFLARGVKGRSQFEPGQAYENLDESLKAQQQRNLVFVLVGVAALGLVILTEKK